MVTPVTDEKMDDRYSTAESPHTHTHTYIRTDLLNGGKQHNGNMWAIINRRDSRNMCPPSTLLLQTLTTLPTPHPHIIHARVPLIDKRQSEKSVTEWLILALQNFWLFLETWAFSPRVCVAALHQMVNIFFFFFFKNLYYASGHTHLDLNPIRRRKTSPARTSSVRA